MVGFEQQPIDPFIKFSVPRDIEDIVTQIEKTSSEGATGSWSAIFNNYLSKLNIVIDLAKLNCFINIEKHKNLSSIFEQLKSKAKAIQKDCEGEPQESEKQELLKKYIEIVELYHEK